MVAMAENDVEQESDSRAGFDQIWSLLRQFGVWLRSRQAKIQITYLIPERSGHGWYVVTKEPVFDFELNTELAVFAGGLIRKGFPIHATLIPGSVPPSAPTDSIVIMPTGEVSTYA